MLADIVDRANTRMIQRRRRSSLALKALECSRITGQFARQELKRNLAPEARVFGAEHLTHAPGTQDFDNPVVRNRFADHFCEETILHTYTAGRVVCATLNLAC